MKINFGATIGGERRGATVNEMDWKDVPEDYQRVVIEEPFGVPFLLDQEKEVDVLVSRFGLERAIKNPLQGEKPVRANVVVTYDDTGKNTPESMCLKVELFGRSKHTSSVVHAPDISASMTAFLQEITSAK